MSQTGSALHHDIDNANIAERYTIACLMRLTESLQPLKVCIYGRLSADVMVQPASAIMMHLNPPMADLELVKLINCLLLHAAPLTVLHCVNTKASACPVPCPENPADVECFLQSLGLAKPQAEAIVQ